MYVFIITMLTMCRHMMRKLRLKQDDRIGFIDPYVVYKDTKTKDSFNLKIKEMEKNLRRFFYNQRHKELYSSLTIWGKVLCYIMS
jgi:hypothetical protein